MYQTAGLLGIAGAFMCIIGDLLLDMKGVDNREIGPLGIINTSWLKMSEWRFRVSILLAMVGVPLAFAGMMAMARLIGSANECAGLWFGAFAVVGCVGGFFIHAYLCMNAIAYKRMKVFATDEHAETVITAVFKAVMIPFFAMYLCLILGTSVVLVVSILKGYLHVPWPMIFFTPPVLMAIGISLRAANRRLFCDLPGIIMPSLGMAMMSLMVILGG